MVFQAILDLKQDQSKTCKMDNADKLLTAQKQSKYKTQKNKYLLNVSIVWTEIELRQEKTYS